MAKVKQQIDPADAQYHKVLASDPLAFCKIACDFTPNPGQEKIMIADLHKCKSVVVAPRRAGKTFTMARKVAYDLFRLPGCKIYIYSPSETQSSILFKDVCLLYRTSQYLSRYVVSAEKGTSLTVHAEPNQSRLMLIKVGPDAAKVRGHGTGSIGGYIIGDEILAHYDARQIANVIEPMILESMGKGGLVYVSSPGEAQPGDFFYDRYCDYLAQEQLAISHGRTPKHRVFRISLEDCNHIDKAEVEDQRRICTAENRLWWFNREYLGEFTISSGAYFNRQHVEQCSRPTPPIQTGDRLSVWVWSFDPGSRGSPAVLQIARYNQHHNRLEVVHVASFIHQDKYKADSGHEIIHEYNDITECVCDLREKYPPATIYVDPNCEKSLTESWANQLHLPVKDECVGGYNQKVKLLGDLERALQEQRIVWTDRRITEQLLRFAPNKNERTNRYEWDSAGQHDQIVCLAMLCRYLGDRELTAFAVDTGARQTTNKWALW